MAITIRSRTPATRPARPRARRRAAPARSSLHAGRRPPRAPDVRQHAGSTPRAAQRQGPVSPSMGRWLFSARSDRSEVVDVRRGTNHSATAASGIGAEYTARDRDRGLRHRKKMMIKYNFFGAASLSVVEVISFARRRAGHVQGAARDRIHRRHPEEPFGQDPAPRPHGTRALLSGPPLTSLSRKGSQCA